MTDADYADDLALLANRSDQSKSSLHSRQQATGGIGLYEKTDKIELMHFKQDGAISTLNSSPLNLVNHFRYNVSSAESDVNIRIGKA